MAEEQGQGQSHSQLERAEAPAGAPYLRVVRGDASPEEIAALIPTLTALATLTAAAARAAASAEPQPAAPNWNSRARLLRSPVHPAAGGWRRSALP
ncbi:MAG TPA: acyl-CoA carboxylase subunit epsilon [Trebonia sp.]|nr:acyl-CoA carboxylase subunit epsilon [Trebonia sp.]